MRRTHQAAQTVAQDMWASCVPPGVAAPVCSADQQAPRGEGSQRGKVPGVVRRKQGARHSARNGAASGCFFITPHAVHKFQREVRPNASYNQALGALIKITDAGRLVSGYNGHTMAERFPGVRLELWRGPVMGTRANQRGDSRMRFVVAYGPGELPQVVTVLPKGKA